MSENVVAVSGLYRESTYMLVHIPVAMQQVDQSEQLFQAVASVVSGGDSAHKLQERYQRLANEEASQCIPNLDE